MDCQASPARARRVLLALAVPAVLLAPALAAGQEAAFPLQPAAVLDAAPFACAASLRARPGAEGVSRVRLTPALLAVAREDLADVRVVDGASRQWPFVLVPDAGREAIELRVEGPRAERGSSAFRLVPPVAPIALDGLTLRVDRPSFDRGYRILAGQSWLAGGRLTRAASDWLRDPAEIALTVPRGRVAELTLVVDDGDEAPLALSAARASSVAAELWLVAPAGEYTLLAGDAAAHAPRYEIAAARARVLGAHAGAAEVGPLTPNPAHQAAVALPGGDGRHTLALWLALGLAVVALGALALRLSRRGPPPADPGGRSA